VPLLPRDIEELGVFVHMIDAVNHSIRLQLQVLSFIHLDVPLPFEATLAPCLSEWPEQALVDGIDSCDIGQRSGLE
jgi:hypothetical protein